MSEPWTAGWWVGRFADAFWWFFLMPLLIRWWRWVGGVEWYLGMPTWVCIVGVILSALACAAIKGLVEP